MIKSNKTNSELIEIFKTSFPKRQNEVDRVIENLDIVDYENKPKNVFEIRETPDGWTSYPLNNVLASTKNMARIIYALETNNIEIISTGFYYAQPLSENEIEKITNSLMNELSLLQNPPAIENRINEINEILNNFL